MKKAMRGLCLLLCAVILCIAANVLAFTIDSRDMRDHVWQGCLMLGEQQSTPQMIGGFLSAQLDNFTGVLILKTAGYVGPESLTQKAFGGFRVDMPAGEGQSEWDAFCNYEFGELSPTGGGMGYARYWHGYTLPLRLLLCVLDVANLQMLLYFAQLLLFILVLHLMHRRGLGELMPGFFLAFFLLMPFSASVCLQYVPVTMLMLAACACVLLWEERLERAVGMPAFFALLGLLTNYFDLLTFPLVSLGYPLVLLLALSLRRGARGKALFCAAALCGVSWALGYGGMWALKWLLNGLVFGWQMLYGIFAQIGLRASDNGGEISRIAVLLENFGVILKKKSYLLLLLLCAAVTLAPAGKAIARRQSLALDLRALNLLLPAAAVCLWYVVLANHSFDHTYFTSRSVTVAVLSGFACLSCLLVPKEKP